MKKYLSFLLLSVLLLALAACGEGNNDKDKDTSKEGTDGEKTVLKVGASHTPHAVILEKAKPILEKEGIELKIEEYQDYILPNEDLNNGDIDANYFQHLPYLNQKVKDEGYDIVNVGEIHVEPIGIYSKKYKSIDELPDGATILISNSISDQGRILTLLETNGLIKLKEGIDKKSATLDDIVENPKNLKIEASDAPEMMVTYYENEEGDAVVINSNFAIDAQLNPKEEAIIMESDDSDYPNVIAVRSEDKDNPAIKKLVEVLQSEEIQNFILEEWNGNVIPVTKK